MLNIDNTEYLLKNSNEQEIKQYGLLYHKKWLEYHNKNKNKKKTLRKKMN